MICALSANAKIFMSNNHFEQWKLYHKDEFHKRYVLHLSFFLFFSLSRDHFFYGRNDCEPQLYIGMQKLNAFNASCRLYKTYYALLCAISTNTRPYAQNFKSNHVFPSCANPTMEKLYCSHNSPSSTKSILLKFLDKIIHLGLKLTYNISCSFLSFLLKQNARDK